MKKSIKILVIMISILVVLASAMGISSIAMKNAYKFTTIYGDTAEIYGGVISLVVSFIIASKGNLKARLLFMAITLYLLFTYGIYTFYAMYNRLYIVYVAIMGLTFFAI